MDQYDSLKRLIETKIEEGQKKGSPLACLENLLVYLETLPDETQRKQMVRETVLTAYWGKEKALSFEDKDVYPALLMARGAYLQWN